MEKQTHTPKKRMTAGEYIAVSTGLSVASVPAFADVADAIEAAKALGIANVSTAVAAVIAIAAVVMGVGIVLRLIGR